ncbi:MAG: hypothetical protein N0E48_03655, partial [Candidatus Thiodiazotropha endolucinida]|nr:hypothetical protein [Candidatus Thiodiazotropha taylori]MCW4342456.1 hypothetical protein [Candidatus Thiodiazotropha endolucinida]
MSCSRLKNDTEHTSFDLSTSNSDSSVHSSPAGDDSGRTDSTGVPDSSPTVHHNGRDSTARNWFEKESLLKFITPCSMSMIGMNNCGKTTYVRKLLEQAEDMFTEPPSRVIYCYNVFQKLFSEMAETVQNLSFYQGLPDRATIESWASAEKHLMLVFDDLYQELIQSKAVCDLTIMLSHHLNISCIMTSHNIFMCAKYSKTISTNLHYILLFTIRNRLQLSVLGGQLFCQKGKAKNFVKVYDMVTSENTYNPLIIDNSP